MTPILKLSFFGFTVLSTLGTTPPVVAQHMNAVDAPCRTAGSGIAQTNCLTAAAKEADTAMLDAYRKILSVLTMPAKQELRTAQRSWLSYRDQTCAAERSLYDGGTGGNAAYPACLEAVTRHRTIDLKAGYWWKVEKAGM